MYYTAQEAADILGVAKRTFNRWVKIGLVKPSYTTLGGHRRYTPQYIHEVKKGLSNEPRNIQDNQSN